MANAAPKRLSEPRVVIDVIDALFGSLEDKKIVAPGAARLTDVPATDRPAGYGLSLSSWARVLQSMQADLHRRRSEYQVLVIDQADITRSHTKALVNAVQRMISEIMDDNRVSLIVTKAMKGQLK